MRINGDVGATAFLISMVAVPAESKIPTPTTTAVFAFVHAINFKVPWRRVKVEAEAAAPLANATAVTDVASVAGAPWTELAEMSPAMMAVVEGMPRRLK